jgi:hypothetical protein
MRTVSLFEPDCKRLRGVHFSPPPPSLFSKIRKNLPKLLKKTPLKALYHWDSTLKMAILSVMSGGERCFCFLFFSAFGRVEYFPSSKGCLERQIFSAYAQRRNEALRAYENMVSKCRP